MLTGKAREYQKERITHDTLRNRLQHEARETIDTKHTHFQHPRHVMRPPRTTSRLRRLQRLARLTAKLSQLLDLMSVLDVLEELEPPESNHRSTLMLRERRSWASYIKPMLGDGTFKGRFRMEHDDFMVLVELLRNDLQRDARMGALRNGAVPVEYQVALTLRWLAGASMYEGMDGYVISRSTAYQTAFRVIAAINKCPQLDCKWPQVEDLVRGAALFKERSTLGVIRKCVGAMDGLFVRTIRPILRGTPEPNTHFSGHKKGFGMNFQVRNTRLSSVDDGGWRLNLRVTCLGVGRAAMRKYCSA